MLADGSHATLTLSGIDPAGVCSPEFLELSEGAPQRAYLKQMAATSTKDCAPCDLFFLLYDLISLSRLSGRRARNTNCALAGCGQNVIFND